MPLRSPTIEIVYYTDPICSWCWATEPMIKKIREVYGDKVRITYRMGGLLENWSTFYDEVNRIWRPEQVAPHWAEVSRATGMPIDERLWLEDPSHSTYPPSIAFKAASFQGEAVANRYLRRLREAALSEKKNIERREVLLQLAKDVGLDPVAFGRDLEGDAAKSAFYADVKEARARGITGFPTLILGVPLGREITLFGHRPFRFYERAIEQLSDGKLTKSRPADMVEFVRKYRHVTSREVDEVFDLTKEEEEKRLNHIERDGKIVSRKIANGYFWEST